jgi:hypothetical protein
MKAEFYVNGVVELKAKVEGRPICLFGFNDPYLERDPDR